MRNNQAQNITTDIAVLPTTYTDQPSPTPPLPINCSFPTPPVALSIPGPPIPIPVAYRDGAHDSPLNTLLIAELHNYINDINGGGIFDRPSVYATKLQAMQKMFELIQSLPELPLDPCSEVSVVSSKGRLEPMLRHMVSQLLSHTKFVRASDIQPIITVVKAEIMNVHPQLADCNVPLFTNVKSRNTQTVPFMGKGLPTFVMISELISPILNSQPYSRQFQLFVFEYVKKHLMVDLMMKKKKYGRQRASGWPDRPTPRWGQYSNESDAIMYVFVFMHFTHITCCYIVRFLVFS